ncbi:hypothetical protein HZD82_27305, partial [Pantoea agglomerans]|nr:hypothetical protein [Pantoea agglomerans]
PAPDYAPRRAPAGEPALCPCHGFSGHRPCSLPLTYGDRARENINIRRVAILEGAELGSYLHGARIGVLVSTKGANEDLI